MTIFLSNRVESLVEELRNNLFSSERILNPFARRLLVVPSQAMESWVRLALAEQGVVTGIEAYFLDQAVTSLASFSRPLPSRIKLMVQLEGEIKKIMAQESEAPLWQPLLGYLQGKEQRIVALCKQLASLFRRYAIYGARAHGEWKEEWQSVLWKRLFAGWDFRLTPKEDLPQDLSVHLFAFSHHSRLHFDFFRRLGEKRAVFFYQLSACQEFWSDMVSEREQRRLLNGKEELESYFKDHHPLLGNLGRVGRKFAELIEESELQTDEKYILPEGESKLHLLQRDLLLLQHSDFSEEDESIQLHISSTPHREIQNLYHTLLSLIDEKGIEPKDILVMAPDITIYEPFIHSIFGEKIDYQIADIPTNEPIQALYLMVELEKKRWSAPALLELFDHPLFRKKQRWGEGDLLLIKEWIGQAGIRWGFDGEHRSRLLKHCKQPFRAERATWRKGIDDLLLQLATTNTIDLTDGQLLGQMAFRIDSLHRDLAQLHDGTEKGLKEWSNHLKYLVETYLAFPESERRGLFKELDQLVRTDIGRSYRFSTFFSLFKEILSDETRTLNGNRLQSVRFFSMLPMRAIPAKVVALIGMNHDNFPRKERLRKLDLLYQAKGSDYYPTRNDFDRYLFLEALLSARESLILSYLGHSPLDGSEAPPSAVLSQIISYCQLDRPAIHPATSFDPCYFDGSEPQLKNYSQTDYRSAAALQRQKQRPHFELTQSKERHFQETIDIAELLSLARYPLKNYFRHQLGLKFRKEEEIKGEEEFLLSPLEMAKLKKESLKKPVQKVIESAEKLGTYPLNTFGQLASNRIEKEMT
ncbi:MAG: RecBCD enzyme subunit RecC, partial [Chlamydiae bacterium]|nr:RecBCD enzyme subunit RecC [Chlamydiota bacterium]